MELVLFRQRRIYGLYDVFIYFFMFPASLKQTNVNAYLNFKTTQFRQINNNFIIAYKSDSKQHGSYKNNAMRACIILLRYWC